MRTRISDLQSQARNSGFTMVEIALCLAIIGFALVAIIAVLPRGLSVQQENREETIIDKDAQVWMDAIRNGAQGFNDLTNYVIAITNYWTDYTTKSVTNVDQSGNGGYVYGLTPSDHGQYGYEPSPSSWFPLTNGFRIIGLLSTPKYTGLNSFAPIASLVNGGRSNYVVAWVRSMSGAAADKFPQQNPTIVKGAFSYRMVVENADYVPAPPVASDSSIAPVRGNLQANSHDLRLLFRWPLLPTGHTGNGRVTFRVFTGGQLIVTNDFWQPQHPLYFFQPSTYVKVQ